MRLLSEIGTRMAEKIGRESLSLQWANYNCKN